MKFFHVSQHQNRGVRGFGGGRSKSKKGVSLIIAIVFVSAIMLVTAGLVETQLRTLQFIRNRRAEIQVRYLRDSSIELATYWAATHQGANTSDITDPSQLSALFAPLYELAGDLGVSDCMQQKCVGFEVIGRSKTDTTAQVRLGSSGYYSVPLKGTGDAAATCEIADDDPFSANDPCHWQKLSFGESVEIPLYYYDNAGNVVKLFTGGFGDMKLRVRSPCKGFVGHCRDADRFMLFPSPLSAEYGDPNKDPVLIQWMITDAADSSKVLVARDALEKKSNIYRETSDLLRQNTEISGGRINLANNSFGQFGNNSLQLMDFTVLQYVSSGLEQHKNPGNLLDRQAKSIGTFVGSLSKPTLRLSLVAHPQKDEGNHPQKLNDTTFDIAYLEYQLLTKDMPVSPTKTAVRGWAEFKGFKKEFTKELKNPSSLGGFVLENL